MEAVITCPNCKTEIPLSDAFKHEIEAGVLAAERARHQRELKVAIKSAETAAAKKADQEAAQREAAQCGIAQAAGEIIRRAERAAPQGRRARPHLPAEACRRRGAHSQRSPQERRGRDRVAAGEKGPRDR